MKFLKKIPAYLAVIIVVVSIVLMVWNPTIDISFTEDQVKAIVAEQLPLTRPVGNNTYTIPAGATVDFTQDGKIRVIGEVNAERKGSTASGNLDAEGELVYNPENGAFYLANIKVHTLDVTEVHLSEGHQELLDAGKEVFNGIAGKFLKDKPATNKLVERYKGEAIEGLKRFAVANLATVPVYKLSKSTVGENFARLALHKITVTDNAMTVTLSIGWFVGKLWLGVIALVAAIGIAFAMVRSGGFWALFALTAAS